MTIVTEPMRTMEVLTASRETIARVTVVRSVTHMRALTS